MKRMAKTDYKELIQQLYMLRIYTRERLAETENPLMIEYYESEIEKITKLIVKSEYNYSSM